VDGVNVLRNFIGVHQRIQPGETNLTAAGHAPKGGSTLDGGQEKDTLHGSGVRIEGVESSSRICRENVKCCPGLPRQLENRKRNVGGKEREVVTGDAKERVAQRSEVVSDRSDE
jgi:hypothetical protein